MHLRLDCTTIPELSFVVTNDFHSFCHTGLKRYELMASTFWRPSPHNYTSSWVAYFLRWVWRVQGNFRFVVIFVWFAQRNHTKLLN